jgi:hypothetical protein
MIEHTLPTSCGIDITNEVLSMLVKLGVESSLRNAGRGTPLLGLLGDELACLAGPSFEKRFGLPAGSVTIGAGSTLGGLIDRVCDQLTDSGPSPASSIGAEVP